MLGSTSPRRFTLRRTALVGILVAAIGALTFTGATAANAVNGDSVGTWSDIQGQVNLGYTPLHLSQDINYNSSGGNSILRIPGDEVIDLNGHTMNMRGILLGRGATVTFEDLSAGGGGAVATNGVGNGVPGIDVGQSSTLNIEDGVSVRATGAADYAGIGSGADVSDPQDLGGSTKLSGVGTINVNDGSLNVFATGGAAAIGGGTGLAGGTLNIAAGSTVTATADPGQSVIGAGHGGSGFGSLDVAGNLDISTGQTMDVPSGASATIDSTGSITGDDDGDGSLTVEGSIANAGAITLPDNHINGASNVIGNNFVVTFNANHVDEVGSLPADGDSVVEDVLAPTLSAGNRSEPTDYTGPGDYRSGWLDNDDPWTKDTVLTEDVTVYGTWTPLTSITVGALKSSAPNGSSVGLTVTGQGPSGLTDDQSTYATFTSSVVGDTFGTASVHLVGTGPHIITAHVTSHTDSGTHLVSTNTVTVTGTGPVASAMTITPVKPTIQAGVVSSFVVSGKDAAGIALGDITNQVTWSGISASKHDSVDPTTNEPIFGTSGTRTLKATIGKHSISTTVKVVAGAPTTLSFVKPATTAVAGAAVSFTVDAKDFAGNSVGDVTSHSTFTIQSPASGETAVGYPVTFTLAGARSVTITDGAASATLPITVTPGRGATFNNIYTTYIFDPQNGGAAGATEVYNKAITGGFTVQDAFGNVFTDTQLADTLQIGLETYPDYVPITTHNVISKNSVSWVQAGTYYVHLTDGDADADLLRSVAPGDAVAGKLTFNFPSATQYVGQAFSLSAFPSDSQGNATGDAVSATLTGGDKNIQFSGSDVTATVTLKTTGKHSVSASADGYTKLTQSFTAIQDTATPSFSSDPITASVSSTFDVTLPTGGSGVAPSGSVTLHYGSKSIKETTSGGLMEFPLPALKVGKYTFYASYSGNPLYKPTTSAKVSVKVVPGDVSYLKFVKAPTSVVAGTTTTYTVDGYDVHNNLIGVDTNATFAISDPGTDDSVTSVDKVKLTKVGAETITATDGTITADSHVTVKIAPASQLQPGGPDYDSTTGKYTITAGVPFTVTATATDQFGNSYGDVSTSLKFTSETSSTDKFVKNVGTLTLAENHGITAKYGAASFGFVVVVNPAAAATGKYVFADLPATTNVGAELGLDVYSADAFGNLVSAIDPADAPVTITPDAPINSAHNTVTFGTLGTYKVTAVTGGVTITKTIKVVKGNVDVELAPGAIVSALGQHLTVTVTTPTGNIIPTGTVVLHFGTRTFSALTLASGSGNTASATFTFTGPAVGSYKVYVTYSGNADWNSTTTSKSTISVGAAV